MDWDKQKPEFPEPYCNWLHDKHGKKIDGATKSNYNHVATQIKEEFEKSPFWLTFLDRFRSYQDEYSEKRGGYGLYPYGFSPVLDVKKYDNFFHKTYRKNCLHNKAYPNSPESGWILPGSWYSQVNDIVRTTVVVKYLDGLDFMLNKILDLCNELGVPEEHRRFDREVKSAGYYAIHFYIQQSFQIPDLRCK